jgi:polyhydroxyalkanoate synthesis regulator phasin
MNTTTLGIALGLAVTALSVPALADTGHQKHEGHATAGQHGRPDLGESTLDGLLGQLDETMKSITVAIGKGELSNIHNLSSDLSRVVKSIPAKVETEKKPRVEGTVRNIAALSDELHVVADRKDEAQVKAKFERLQRLVALLQTQAR